MPPRPRAAGRWLPTALRASASLLIALAMTACAELPKNVDRPESVALASPAGTALGDLVTARRGTAAAASGFALLDGPQSAYGARLALADGAQKTLDLQYYAIHADASTGRLMRSVREAAARGVRVRILIDDFHSTGRNALVLQLAYEKNIEVRLFNPLAGARSSTIGRVLNSLGDAKRIQQRMHNKLFIADNAMGITGGRNLGDAYFGHGDAGNFVDLDVLAAGPVVREMSKSFDSYWNNERAYPVQSLVSREELDKIREKARADRDKGKGSSDAPKPPDGEPRPSGGAFEGDGAKDKSQAEAQRRARVWDQKALDLKTLPFTWAPATLIADGPAKIAADAQAAAGPAPSAPRPPAGELPTGETVVEGLLQFIGQARRDLLIISPYFVPGPEIKKAFADARARGVRIRILTNSLASNDAPIAHVGYARHRDEMLGMSIELYEMRSEQATLGSALGASGAGVTGESRAMLHSKVLVLDGRLLVVGSMNLDLRSQEQNTEIALLIRSAALSKQATDLIETSLREGAWHVEKNPEGSGLVWRAPQGSGLKDARSEPDASVGLRMLLKVIGPLAPDSML
ncbi:Cardiolipin synthase C [Xylophilus ampelinus]|nr:phospholipase D family protein [Variovorax sp.]VTY38524.1 Cardiolipin synthase C [Xylophilus ampelinus]